MWLHVTSATVYCIPAAKVSEVNWTSVEQLRARRYRICTRGGEMLPRKDAFLICVLVSHAGACFLCARAVPKQGCDQIKCCCDQIMCCCYQWKSLSGALCHMVLQDN